MGHYYWPCRIKIVYNGILQILLLYANKLNTLAQMDKLVAKHKLLKLTQEEIEE